MADQQEGREPVRRDAELVDALLAGDEAVFARVVDAWSPAMLRLARLHVQSTHTAQDVVQETWLVVLQGLQQFAGRSSLRTWVFAILLNTARRHGVREQRCIPVEVQDEDRGPTVDPARFQGPGGQYPGGWKSFPAAWPAPEDAVLAGEIRRIIEEALSHLPERQRIVMDLRDIHGCDPAEVCGWLGLTPGNQRVLLHRARSFVRARVEDYLGVRVSPQREPT